MAVALSPRQQQKEHQKNQPPAPLLPQATWDHIRSHIYESRHCTARLIGRLSEISALRVDVVAQLMAATVVLLLFVPELAPLVAGLVLIGYPLATTYLYPEERASRDSLLIYWASYALLTFFDRYLEVIPGYYVLKIGLLSLLFLEPWHFVDNLEQSAAGCRLSKSMFQKSELEILSKRNKRSPRPETPEEEQAHSVANNSMKTATAKPKSTVAKVVDPTANQSISPVTTAKSVSSCSAVSIGLEQKPLTKKWLSPAKKFKAVPLDLHPWKKAPAAEKKTSDLSSSMSTAVGTAASSQPMSPGNSQKSTAKSPGSSRKETAKSPGSSRKNTAKSPDASQKSITARSLGNSQRSPSVWKRKEPVTALLSPQWTPAASSGPQSVYVPTYQEPPLPSGLISPPNEQSSLSATSTSSAATLTRTAQAISTTSAVAVTSAVDLANQERFRGENPMTVDSSYRLDPTVPVADDRPTTTSGPGSNPGALEFYPGHQLVFNAPFDFDHVTYHMMIKNNSAHNVAFAVKGNAVPRVLAYPPSGILTAGKAMLIGVTVQKFDWNPSDFNQDRICIEYVMLKDELGDVNEFSHSLFQNSDLKKRRNIHVNYNV